MTAPPVICLDFETFPIASRPDYPPLPVGVAIKWPGHASRYYACGHPTGNNCTPNEALEAISVAWHHPMPKLFHNSKFDVAVACEQLGLPMLPWEKIHDSMFLAFLCDPHERQLGLKPLSAKWLGMPPEERSELDDWIMSHGVTLLQTYPWNKKTPHQSKITKSQCGAWIFATPGDLAGRYAIGDVERTVGMFNEQWPLVVDHGMQAAYDRERQLMPILMENERIGIRTDLEGLERDITRYTAAFNQVEDGLRYQLRASGLNFDADADVSALLLERGIVPADNWQLTDSGKLSMSKDNLFPEHFTGPGGREIASALGYRNRLKTCLSMFMEPWRDQARQMGGYITTNWNQTRGGDAGGTRTGRPSTNDHNLLNVSKKWDGRDDGYVHPWFIDAPPLPLCRNYLLPDEDEEWLHRDFNQQEMRIFAHAEQGALWEAYQKDPDTNPHAFVGAELMRVAGREIDSTKVKTLNFQGLYGGGIPALQRKVRCTLAEAKELKKFHDAALPGRKILNEEIAKVIGRGLPIRTWGGRLYFAEPPGADGRNKLYKLINYYCQGSAADLTKETIVVWHSAKGRTARFLTTLYDENNISAQRGAAAAKEMKLLKDVMEETRLTVQMRSSPKHGASWGLSKRCPPDKGCPLCQ